MWGSQFWIVLFQQSSYASGLQAFKRDLPRAELQWAAWFRLCVSLVCLQRGCPRGNQLWSSAFTLLLTWMWLLPWPSFPWSASAHPAASVSDLSGPSTLPAGLLCGIGAVIQKGLSPQSEKSRPWPSFLWAGLTTATAYAAPATASSPKPSQWRGQLWSQFTFMISCEGFDRTVC